MSRSIAFISLCIGVSGAVTACDLSPLAIFDAGTPDPGQDDAERARDSAGPDADGFSDAGEHTGQEDALPSDGGVKDAGATDALFDDAGTTDAAPSDALAKDAVADAVAVDAGASDANDSDASPLLGPDADTDAGSFTGLDADTDAAGPPDQDADVDAGCPFPSGLDEVEPNDSIGTATLISLGGLAGFQDVTGAICPNADIDYWRFSVGSGLLRMTATTFGTAGDPTSCNGIGDTALTLYTSTGNPIDYDNDSGDGPCSRIERGLAGGNYYLKVASRSGPIAMYYLRVQLTP